MLKGSARKRVKIYREADLNDAALAYKAHLDALAWQEFLVMLATVIAAMGSIGLSFVGTVYSLERDGGLSFNTTGAALIITIIVGVFQVIGWKILLDTKHYDRGWKKLCGALCAVGFLVFGYGTSSYFNYASVTSASAMVIYRSDQVEQLAAVMEALRRQDEAASQLLPLIEGEAQAGCSAAKLEVETGAFSGSPGKGQVSGILDGICQRASAAVYAMRQAVAANAANAARADSVLGRLEDLLSDANGDALERERLIMKEVRELEAAIREIRGARMVESAEAFFQTLTTSVSALGDSRGSGLQARQTKALLALRKGFEEREPIIRGMIASITGQMPDIKPMNARPSVHEMLWHSVDKHPQNVLVAAGIDSFAVFMILVLLLKQPSRTRAEPKPGGLERSRDIPAALLDGDAHNSRKNRK